MRGILKKNKPNKHKWPFQLLFLRDDPTKSVRVEEVEEIDFKAVRAHLEKGHSIFITPKRRQA